MKNLNRLFQLSAIALTGMAFVACSDDEVAVSPTYNDATKEVTTEFVLSIANGNRSATTRMDAANTQANIEQTFRGIDHTYLMSFKTGEGKYFTDATGAADKYYELGKVLSKGELDPDAGDGASVDRSRRVLELTLPLGTTNMLFYGKAIKDPVTGANNTNFTQGNIVYNVQPTDIANTTFSLVPLIKNDDNDATNVKVQKVQKIIGKILTRIIRNGFNGDKAENSTIVTAEELTFTIDESFTKTDGTPIALDWSDYNTSDGKSPVATNQPQSPLEEILAHTYAQFAGALTTGEVRAGSGAAITKMIADMKGVIDQVAKAEPTNLQGHVAKQMALRLKTRLETYFENEGQFKSTAITELKKHMQGDGNIPEDDDFNDFETNSVFTGVVISDLQDFPTTFGLPMGAAQLLVDANSKTISYASDLDFKIGDAKTSIYKYMYPAELTYFGNSPIRVSDDAHEKSQYPDGADNWYTDNTKWSSWDKGGEPGKVKSTTRSVAMRDNINYGTALLKSTVKYKEGITEVEDNNGGIHTGEANIKINISEAPFIVTGFVIGGQAQTMAWNFVPNSGEKFDCLIYDKEVANVAFGNPNYTLVWDNYNGADGANQNEVYIAVEFVNNSGKDIWGQHNMIRKGGTFYIVGKLDPASAGDITWPSNDKPYLLPPYDSAGKTIQTKRVFIQDYMTEANFTFSAESLQHAYVTVPDLRSNDISLGLSVDLEWRTGLTFESELGK